jgi:HAD superfamily hydrolase (TIGR01509 family)
VDPSRHPRAILFDAGNTLIRMDYSAIVGHLDGRGCSRTVEQVEEAELVARVRLDGDLATGASTESTDTHARYLRYVLLELGITNADEVEAIARWRRGYDPPAGLWNRADPEARAALRRVKASGLVTGVISNSNGSVGAILDATGLAPYLDFVLDSAVVGVEKPDPRIFQLGLARAGVPAAAAVYIGDLYSVDVLGARGAGLDAVLIDPRGHWGRRDCRLARGIEHAVRLCLGE